MNRFSPLLTQTIGLLLGLLLGFGAVGRRPVRAGSLPAGNLSLLTSPNPAESLRVAEADLGRLNAGSPARAAVHVRLGTALLELRRYGPALQHARAALGQHQLASIGDRAEGLRLLGRVQLAQGDTGQARQTFMRALQLAARVGNPAAQASLHEHLGDLSASQQAWPQAQRRYELAYGLWQRSGNAASAAVALHAVGRMHLARRQFSRALYYLGQSTRLARQLGDSTGTGHVLLTTGQVYAAVGNHVLAQGFYTQALAQLPPRGFPALRGRMYQALAAAHDSLGHRNVAGELLQRAIVLARVSGDLDWKSELYLTLARLQRRQGNVTGALGSLTRYVSLRDSAAGERHLTQVEELRARYEADKKEREIELLTKNRLIQEANLRRQKLARNVLAVGTALLLLLVAGLVRGRREQRRVNRLLQRKNTAISRQKEELDRLNRTKDTLFSVISHDLRSPLSSLYSLLALLNLGALPPERLATHTQRLTRTLDTTLGLLDNLLNWAASQMQGTSLRPERVRLDDMAEECLALLLGDAERKQILLLNQLPKPCQAQADANMARLVLRNLLGNAIKFTPTGGTVALTARLVGEQWEIRVSDTGVGISVADQAKILAEAEPHTTLGTAREKGIGLGLRLCKDFVERHGGRLSFESRLGEGSTFCFTLPALAPQGGEQPATVPAAIPAAESAGG
ncbi:ATP-binding protein [Hymenobacter sp. B81]|uniref:sensor histidine kinase n=1 Tax=Hymenobacter sp. B81 TaxID=3344878 RepID=UPI0037DCBC3B